MTAPAWTVEPTGRRWALHFAGVELASYASEQAAGAAFAELLDAGRVPEWLPAETNPFEPFTAQWFDWFDVILPQTSGGKDSERMMARALPILRTAGVMHKVAALHIWLDRRHDLDDSDRARVEWQQVPALAAEQARRHGLPLADGQGWAVWDARERRDQVTHEAWAGRMHFARRTNRDRTDFDGDLLDDIATRTKRDGTPRGWPTMWTRYCTSDWKTAVGRAFAEFIAAQLRRDLGLTRPVRVLQLMGFRAEESDDRAGRAPYALNYGVSARDSRHTWEWLPIHDMTARQVWAGIRADGVPYHPAYDEGMSRLSCRGCIMASRGDLATMKRLVPASSAVLESIEADLGDPFQHRRPLASIPAAPGRQGFAVNWTTCPACAVPVLSREWETARGCPAHADTGPWDRTDRAEPAPACTQPALFVSSWGGAL